MTYFHELPVYKASYDLLLGIFQFTKKNKIFVAFNNEIPERWMREWMRLS
jgi:hypothetical protein